MFLFTNIVETSKLFNKNTFLMLYTENSQELVPTLIIVAP